jgi:hypothetical protein
MVISGLWGALVLSVSIAASVGPVGEQCNLGTKYHVSSVAPYRVTENLGFVEETKVRGADVRVEAAPGLTQVWLQSRLQTQIDNGECDLGVRNVTVNVFPAGDHFSVQLSGPDDHAAHEILSHAQQLMK